ncbi:hypothetical protein FrEUN1fDRAFT_1746 [Parafrankia sp. EUN1f]|nr:hypothetical protein FrEUN1fDRAFT_1746 [Parafrankia sp. EUN1f]
MVVVRGQLRYPKAWPSEPAQAKGIDVAPAVDFVRLPCEGAYLDADDYAACRDHTDYTAI